MHIHVSGFMPSFSCLECRKRYTRQAGQHWILPADCVKTPTDETEHSDDYDCRHDGCSHSDVGDSHFLTTN